MALVRMLGLGLKVPGSADFLILFYPMCLPVRHAIILKPGIRGI